jgi:N-glycosylase/DNA lyase
MTARTRRECDLSVAGVVELCCDGYPPRLVEWGQRWHIGSAAYWVAVTEQAVMEGHLGSGAGRHRLGTSLREELAACMLGGHGMPYELGLAAFERLRDAGVLDDPGAEASDIEILLREPLLVAGCRRRYRFPKQRAERISTALAVLRHEAPPVEGRALRDWLLRIPGIGPKTAGWVVRNYLDSDDIAIIDVHIHRAGVVAGVFDPRWSTERNYSELEAFMIAWAHEGRVSPADLDAVIWREQALAARMTRA